MTRALTVAALLAATLSLHGQGPAPTAKPIVVNAKSAPALDPLVASEAEAATAKSALIRTGFQVQADRAAAPYDQQVAALVSESRKRYPGYHLEVDPQTLKAQLVADSATTAGK